MSKDTDRTICRRASDHKWVDKCNGADRGFIFDSQREAILSGRSKLINAGGGELTIKAGMV